MLPWIFLLGGRRVPSLCQVFREASPLAPFWRPAEHSRKLLQLHATRSLLTHSAPPLLAGQPLRRLLQSGHVRREAVGTPLHAPTQPQNLISSNESSLFQGASWQHGSIRCPAYLQICCLPRSPDRSGRGPRRESQRSRLELAAWTSQTDCTRL